MKNLVYNKGNRSHKFYTIPLKDRNHVQTYPLGIRIWKQVYLYEGYIDLRVSCL